MTENKKWFACRSLRSCLEFPRGSAQLRKVYIYEEWKLSFLAWRMNVWCIYTCIRVCDWPIHKNISARHGYSMTILLFFIFEVRFFFFFFSLFFFSSLTPFLFRLLPHSSPSLFLGYFSLLIQWGSRAILFCVTNDQTERRARARRSRARTTFLQNLFHPAEHIHHHRRGGLRGFCRIRSSRKTRRNFSWREEKKIHFVVLFLLPVLLS